MLYPQIEAALDKLLDQYRRLKSPGKYYVDGATPLAVFYPGMATFISTMSLICVVAILDDALEEYIQANGNGSTANLFQRIELLDRLGLLRNATRLHAIRDLRNACAHEKGKFMQWEEFESCFDDARCELVHLGIVA